MQQVGAPAALYDHPVNPFVAGFVGTMNLLPGLVRERDGKTLTLEIEGVGNVQWPLSNKAGAVPDSPRLLLSFRPHAVTMQAEDGAGDAAFVWVPGTVESREFLGESTRYRLRVGSHALAVDQPHHAGAPGYDAGTSVRVGLQASQVQLFPN